MPLPKHSTLGESIKAMSEQKSYMQQLDEWTDANIILPIVEAWKEHEHMLDVEPEEEDNLYQKACANVMKAIREKVLQSYRNGQKAGPPKQWTAKNKQQK